MTFKTSGSLTTDKRQVATSETWDTQAEWEAYQSAGGVNITNGIVKLLSLPASTILHVDATQETFSDGESVSAITDFSGEGNDLTGGSPTYQTNIKNGNPVFRFDGVDDELTKSTPTTNQAYTFIYVVQTNDNEAVQSPFTTFNDGAERATLDHQHDTQDSMLAFAGTSLGGSTPTTSWQIISCVFDGSNSVVRRNGNSILSGDVGLQSWGGFRLGDHYAASRPLDGDLGELLFCTTDLRGTNELAEQEQSLASKWGITLA